MEAVAAEADARLARALQSNPKKPRKRKLLQALADRAFKFAVQDPHLFRLASRQGPHVKHPLSRVATLRDEIAAIVRAGQMGRTAPEFPAQLIWTLFCGLFSMRESGELDSDRALQQAWVRATWDLRVALAGCFLTSAS